MAAAVKEPPGGRPRVRSYGARRGRLSALTVERLARLGPARFLPEDTVLAGASVRGASAGGTAPFGRSAPLVLDLGCGHGASTVGYGLAFPCHDVLGVDVYQPGIARMLAAADAAGATNVYAHVGDAVSLLESRVLPQALEEVHLFFPDPWPKSKHAKRRFVSPYTVGLLHSRLRAEGRVLVATDKPDYARYVVQQVTRSGLFTVREATPPPWRPTDGFEAKARAAGHPVTDLVLERAAGSHRQ